MFERFTNFIFKRGDLKKFTFSQVCLVFLQDVYLYGVFHLDILVDHVFKFYILVLTCDLYI